MSGDAGIACTEDRMTINDKSGDRYVKATPTNDPSIARMASDREQSTAGAAAAFDLLSLMGARERNPCRVRAHGNLRLN
jgi:hypothetical protein